MACIMQASGGRQVAGLPLAHFQWVERPLWRVRGSLPRRRTVQASQSTQTQPRSVNSWPYRIDGELKNRHAKTTACAQPKGVSRRSRGGICLSGGICISDSLGATGGRGRHVLAVVSRRQLQTIVRRVRGRKISFRVELDGKAYATTGNASILALLARSFGRDITSSRSPPRSPRACGIQAEFQIEVEALGRWRSASTKGAVKTVTVLPTKPPHPEAVPVTDEHKRNVFDPMSSILAMTHAGAGIRARSTIPIFIARSASIW